MKLLLSRNEEIFSKYLVRISRRYKIYGRRMDCRRWKK